jgi:hypothetical protein
MEDLNNETSEISVPLMVPVVTTLEDGSKDSVSSSGRVDSAHGPTDTETRMMITDLDWKVYGYLVVCGMIYHDKSTTVRWLLRAWNLVVIGVVVYFVVYTIWNLISDIGQARQVIINSSLVVQFVGLVMGTYFNVNRLSSRYNKQYANCLQKALSVVLILVITMVLVSIVAIIIYSKTAANPDAPNYFGKQFVLAVLLGGNILFLIADAEAASGSLQSVLLEIRRGHELTADHVTTIRHGMRRIIANGMNGNSAIMMAAITNVVAVFALVIIARDSLALIFLDIFGILFREILASCAGLYFVALVNEKYDDLVTLLSQCLHSKLLESAGTDNNFMRNNAVLNCLHVEPMTYSIVGMTLRRKDLLFRFGLWLFGILLSVFSRRL